MHPGLKQSEMQPTKNSEYDQEIPQSQTADNPVAPRGRAAQPSRGTILHSLTMGVTINKKSTTTEPPP